MAASGLTVVDLAQEVIARCGHSLVVSSLSLVVVVSGLGTRLMLLADGHDGCFMPSRLELLGSWLLLGNERLDGRVDVGFLGQLFAGQMLLLVVFAAAGLGDSSHTSVDIKSQSGLIS